MLQLWSNRQPRASTTDNLVRVRGCLRISKGLRWSRSKKNRKSGSVERRKQKLFRDADQTDGDIATPMQKCTDGQDPTSDLETKV